MAITRSVVCDRLRDVVRRRLTGALPTEGAGVGDLLSLLFEADLDQDDEMSFGYIFALTFRLAGASMHLLSGTNFRVPESAWLEMWQHWHPDGLGGLLDEQIDDEMLLLMLRDIAVEAAGIQTVPRLVQDDPAITMALLLGWLVTFSYALEELDAGPSSVTLVTLADFDDRRLLNAGLLLSALRDVYLR